MQCLRLSPEEVGQASLMVELAPRATHLYSRGV